MAWRDSRRGRMRLLWFSFSIMIGIAALVAMGAVRQSLLDAVEREARALLGADVYLNARKPLTPKAEDLVARVPARVLRETALTVMAVSPATGNSKLVQARGVEPGFPFYGAPVTDPPEAWAKCLAGEGFVVDPALTEALQVKTGDTIKLGDVELPLLGVLLKAPPQVSGLGVFAPELFMARPLAAKTGLTGGNDFTFHRLWLQVPPKLNVERHVVERLRRPLNAEGVQMETVAGRKRTIGAVLEVLYSFVSLIAFIAVALGGLGVAGAMRVHAQERLPRVATLRCLGAPAGKALAVYVAQGILLGLAGAAGGVVVGLAAQYVAPLVLNRVLPLRLEPGLSLGAAATALGFGFLICVSFALLPLLKVRRVPPLAAVRAQIVTPRGGGFWRDPLAWGILLILAAAMTALAVSLSPPQARLTGVGFTAALAGGLLLLAGTAWSVTRLARKIARPWWPFVARQGLAGLYRPKNQTLLFLVAGGLGVSLVLSTVLVQDMILKRFDSRLMRGKANFYVIDVKTTQREAVREKLRELQAPPVDEAPIVLTTVVQVNGKTPSEPRDAGDRRERPSGRALSQVYRATWRENPGESEEVVEGEWVARHEADAPGPVPVSLEEDAARRLRVKVGDRVTFNAGTRRLECVVTSLRKVHWEDMRLNFLIVFPAGLAESLPHTWAVSARLGSPAEGARAQRELTAAFSNLTIFDLGAAVGVIEDILDRAGRVVRWLTGLVAATGVLILLAVIMAGRRDRIEESVLLRTLGASRRQIRHILTMEYLLLGFLSALTGALLSLGFAWLLARFVFKLPFSAWWLPLGVAVAVVCGLTLLLGALLSRGVATHPPLAILRQEV